MNASRLYLEPLGPPARERLAALIAGAKAGDPLAPVTVVVPSPYAGISLRRALATDAGLFNVRFMPLARLAEYLGSPAMAGAGKAPLKPLAELAAIRAVAREAAADGPLAPLADHLGLHQSLRWTFAELDRLTGEGIAALERTDAVRRQVVGWHRLARRRLARLYTREELARAAAEASDSGQAAATLRDLGLVVVYLVHDLSPAETALVEALARQGRCAAVFGLAGEPGADLATRHAASRLDRALGAPAGELSAAHGSAVEADHLLSAPDAHEEVHWAVRRIAQDADGGLPFHRMAVVYRQADPYSGLVAGQLRLARIPVAGPSPLLLRDGPAGRLLEGLMAVVEGDFAREAVTAWIAESPVRLADGTPAAAELARWEVISRRAGIIRGVPEWLDRLDRYRRSVAEQLRHLQDMDEASPAQLGGLAGLADSATRLRAFVERLAADAAPPTRGRWRDYAAWAKRLMERYALDPRGWPEEERDSYEAVAGRLDELAGLDVEPEEDGGRTAFADFRTLLADALATPAGRAGRLGTGVFVGPIWATVGMDFEVVYLVGMAEGAFPPRLLESALLPDRLRQPTGADPAGPPRDVRRGNERRLFLAALASGRKRVLTYPRTDPSARRRQFPSPWLLEAAGRLAGSPVASAELGRLADRGWLTVMQSAEQGARLALTAVAADEHDYDVAGVARWRANGRPLERHFLAGGASPLGRALAMQAARRSADLTPWDGLVAEVAGTSGRLRAVVEGRVSATRLERWATCPYRYFLGDVLRVSALESPEETLTISPADRGVLVHKVLQRLVTEARASVGVPGPGAAWSDVHRALLRRIAREEFARAEANGVTGRPALWRVASSDILDDLDAFLEHDSMWRAQTGSSPAWVEWRFGFADGDAPSPVALALPDGGEVRFRGVVDRVDLDASGATATVIDYKTGNAGPYDDMKKDPLGRGKHLQLPVYALAVRSASGATDVKAVYWFATARGGFERREVDLAQVDEEFRRVARTIVAGIEAGVFPANPGRPREDGFESCAICDFGRVCPSNRDILWGRKRGSAAAAAYTRLGDDEGEAQ